MYAYRFTDEKGVTKTEWSFCADDFKDNLVEAIELASKMEGVVYLEMVDIFELLDIYEILTGRGGLALKRIKFLKVVDVEKGNLSTEGIRCIYSVSCFDDEDIEDRTEWIRKHNVNLV